VAEISAEEKHAAEKVVKLSVSKKNMQQGM
jgi:hypothetical protein